MTMRNGGRLARIVSVLMAAILGGSALVSAQGDAEERVPVDVSADDYSYSPETGLAHGEGDVVVTYQDVRLEADSVDVNFKTWQISASGNVRLRRDNFEWEGEAVSGNIRQKRFRFGHFDVTNGVWYGKGNEGRYRESGVAEVEKVRMSTCDLADPHYSITAKRVLYYPDGRFRAYHTIYRVMGVPVFYWPVVFGDARPESGSVQIRPGYSSDWGAYLLLARTWQVSDTLETTMRLDLRSKNGIAVGNETRHRTDYADTDVSLYGLYDTDPPENTPGYAKGMGEDYNRRFEVQEWRGRAAVYHRRELDQALTLRANVDYLSDIDMLEDWFESEYDRNPQPASFADVTFDGQRVHLSMAARGQINDFYTVKEELPELRLEMPRQKLSAGLPLLYQGTTTAGLYEMNWREFELDRPLPGLDDPADYDSVRLDSLHMLYLPIDLGRRVKIVPRAGIRLTHYGDSSDTDIDLGDLAALFAVDDPFNPGSTMPVVNYDDDGGSLTRLAGEVGLEMSTKFYRVWPDLVNGRLHLDGLRHIVEPYVNYTLAPDPSEDRDNIYYFDAVDRLTAQNVVRVGLDQRLQTRRNKQVYTVARIQSYADFHFRDDNDNEQGYDTPGDFGTRVELMPTEQVKVWGTVVANLDEMDVRRGEFGFDVRRQDGIRFSLAYLYRDNYVPRSTVSMGSSLLDVTGEHDYLIREYVKTHTAVGRLFVPINEKTAGRIRLEFDLEEGEISEQVYEIVRDLHCWMGSLAVGEENGDVSVMVMLYLKAYPGTKLDVGI